MNQGNEKEVTLDDLAGMVQRGFEETAKTKEVNSRFDAVEKRLERIENLFIEEHRRRIERLEGEMKEVRDALAMK